MQHLDWTATLNSIRESVPLAQYLSWIEPLELIQKDETSVRLGVPSQFHEDMLRGSLKQQILHAIEKQTGKPIQLEFEVLAKTNLEASQSLATPPLEVSVPQRPSLRVIDGARAHVEVEIPLEERAVNLRPKYPKFTTEFFDVPYNRVVSQAAGLFVQGKDANLSSLVLVGGVGMGKTHLLSSIADRLLEKTPNLRLRYTSAESYTAELIQSYRDNSTHEVKMRYREETDVLLFDDIHQLQGREKIQEQVVHLLNELSTLGKRFVFTSKVPISRLTKIIDPLRSRLLSFISLEMGTPTADDRLELLTKVVEANHIVIEGQVLRHLAEDGSIDVRELIGSLLRLHVQSRLENKILDAEYVLRRKSFQHTTRSQISLEEIVSLIELNFGVSRQDLSAKGRKSNIAWARQVAMYLARHMTYLPLEEIGQFFGRDHATVLYAFEKVAEGVRTQRDIQLQIEYLLEKLKTKAPKK